MRTRTSGVAIGLCSILVVMVSGIAAAALSLQEEKPKPQIDFNLTGGKEFSGGEEVPMRGDIDPATVTERVVIRTQRFRNGEWRPYDRHAVRSNEQGGFRYRHPPLPTGSRYRARAEVEETVDHQPGKNPWVPFSVRRNH